VGGAPPTNFPLWSAYPHKSAAARRGIHGVGVWTRNSGQHRVEPVKEVPGKALWFKLDGWLLVANVYLPPSDDVADILAYLTPPEEAERMPVLVMGDFNMHIVEVSHTSPASLRGAVLGPLLLSWGLSRVIPDTPGPTFRNSRGGTSVVDYCFTSLPLDAVHLRHSTTHDESDHYTIVASIDSRVVGRQPAPATVPAGPPRIRMSKFCAERYHPAVASRCRALIERFAQWAGAWVPNPATPQRIVDELDSALTSALMETARAQCGTSRGPSRRRLPPAVVEAQQRCRELGAQVARFNARTATPPRDLLRRLDEAHAVRKAVTSQWTMAVWDTRIRMYLLQRHNERTRNLAARVRRARRPPCQLPCDAASMEHYRQHFEGMFAQQEWQPPPVELPAPASPWASFSPTRVYGGWDVSHVLAYLNRHKAPGFSGVTNALVKDAPRNGELARTIALLFTMCAQWSVVPRSWTVARLVPVPKKGNLSEICNYRPISVTETLRKLFERVVLAEVQSSVRSDAGLDVAQGGFRAQRSTTDQIAALVEGRAQRQYKLKRSPIMAFLDIKAAYDSVDRSRLWSKLLSYGTAPGLVSLLRALFDQNSSRVFVNGHMSGELQHVRGLLQGSILSPWLYAVFINELLAQLREKARWAMGGVPVAVFAYADDLALLADDPSHLREMLDVCERYAAEHGFRFAPTKCELVGPDREALRPLTLHGAAMRVSDTFVYLGMPLCVSGVDVKAHIARVSQKVRASVATVYAAGLHAYGVGPLLAVQAYTTFVRPVLEYCLQLGRVATGCRAALERLQRFALKTLLALPTSTSTALLYQITGLPPMPDRAVELGGRWVARLATLPDDGSFLVRTALRERETAGCRAGSCLRALPGVAELAGELLTSCPREDWRLYLKERRLEMLAQRFDADDDANQCLPRAPGLCLRQISVAADRQVSNFLLHVAANRYLGKPEACRLCHNGTTTPAHVRLCTATFPRVFFRLGDMFLAGVHAATSLSACLRRRTVGLLAGLREAFLNSPTARAARVRILKASLSDEQLALRALHARLSAQAQRGAFDEPDSTPLEVGTPDVLADAFIAFAPFQTAE